MAGQLKEWCDEWSIVDEKEYARIDRKYARLAEKQYNEKRGGKSRTF